MQFSCTFKSHESPPTQTSQAAQIDVDRQALIRAFQEMNDAAFELEAYMDTARTNLKDGAEWSEEHAEMESRFQTLKKAFDHTKAILEQHKSNIKVLKAPSENLEALPQPAHNE